MGRRVNPKGEKNDPRFIGLRTGVKLAERGCDVQPTRDEEMSGAEACAASDCREVSIKDRGNEHAAVDGPSVSDFAIRPDFAFIRLRVGACLCTQVVRWSA